MKKILFIVIFSILINPLYAGPKDKVKKSGFISKKNIHPIKNDFNIDDVVDYTKEDILSSSKKYDIVFDANGNLSFPTHQKYCRLTEYM